MLKWLGTTHNECRVWKKGWTGQIFGSASAVFSLRTGVIGGGRVERKKGGGRGDKRGGRGGGVEGEKERGRKRGGEEKGGEEEGKGNGGD